MYQMLTFSLICLPLLFLAVCVHTHTHTFLEAGSHKVVWDGTELLGSRYPASASQVVEITGMHLASDLCIKGQYGHHDLTTKLDSVS